MAKIVKGKDFQGKVGADGTVTLPVRHTVPVIPPEGGVIGHRVLSAQQKAEKILADAEEEALHIRDEAAAVLHQAESAREEAKRQGYMAGESKGLSQVTEKLIQLQVLKEKFYAEAEPEILKLSMAIAEKVIGQLVTENPEMIRSVVRQALERSLGDRITVRLNPEDYRTITAGDAEFRDIVDRTRRLIFKEDEAILKGGCIVETEVGTIDAQIETQLEAIRKALGV